MSLAGRPSVDLVDEALTDAATGDGGVYGQLLEMGVAVDHVDQGESHQAPVDVGGPRPSGVDVAPQLLDRGGGMVGDVLLPISANSRPARNSTCRTSSSSSALAG